MVGNLTVGGTGKTPMILWLIGHLRARGLKVGVVSRGYGATPPSLPWRVRASDTAAVAGDAGVATEDRSATEERLGAPFAGALLLDQQASGAKARSIGGWTPSRPTLVEELRRSAG